MDPKKLHRVNTFHRNVYTLDPDTNGTAGNIRDMPPLDERNEGVSDHERIA